MGIQFRIYLSLPFIKKYGLTVSALLDGSRNTNLLDFSRMVITRIPPILKQRDCNVNKQLQNCKQAIHTKYLVLRLSNALFTIV